jgi:hypothetical protein
MVNTEKKPTKNNKQKKNTIKNTRFRKKRGQSFGKSSGVIP